MFGLPEFVLAAVTVIVVAQLVANRARRRLGGREIGVLSWAGTRGVISLAAIFAVPATASGGQPFPGRDLLLFCTFLVVVVTLVGQVLGVQADPADEEWLRREARAAAVRAGLTRLDEIAASLTRLDEIASGELAGPAPAALRVSPEHKAGRRQSLAADDAAFRVRREVIDAQRAELLRWRDVGLLSDAGLRVIQRELDHEERQTCRPAPYRSNRKRCFRRYKALRAPQ